MAKNLVTIDEFKTYKSINNTEQDELIEQLIVSVSVFIKEYCGKTFVDFANVDKIEFFDSVDVTEIFVDEYPILSITSLEYSTDGGATYVSPALVEFTNYFVNFETGKITAKTTFDLNSSTIGPGISDRSGRVTYKGGYLKVPKDISQAAMDLIEYYREAEYTPRKDFSGFKVENLGFRAGSSVSLPSHIKRILERYKEL